MLFLFVLLCSANSINLIFQVGDWGNRLSAVDAGSEANSLREVRHFLEEGLTKYYGLGNINYPGMYPDDGMTPSYLASPYSDSSEIDYVRRYVLTNEGVYTHYPPGPEYLLYAAAKVLGLEPVSRLRLLPITLGWASMLFLGLTIRHRFGEIVGWLVMGALAATPTVNNAFVGLHSQGYAFALLLLEIAMCVRGGAGSILFAVLGFCQGWLSFDYAFLVCLAPLVIEGAMPRIDSEYQCRWPLAWRRGILAGAGFACAHVLHFAEVWAYWGSFSSAFNDIVTAARYRAGTGSSGGVMGHIVAADQLLNNYYVGAHPFSSDAFRVAADRDPTWLSFRFLGLSLGPWWAAITATLAVRQFLFHNENAKSLADDWLRVSFVGFVASSAWFMVMVNHGMMNQPYLYRHLFLVFFVCVLFGAVRVHRHRFTEPALQPAE
jgi:hypothetical protein